MERRGRAEGDDLSANGYGFSAASQGYCASPASCGPRHSVHCRSVVSTASSSTELYYLTKGDVFKKILPGLTQ